MQQCPHGLCESCLSAACAVWCLTSGTCDDDDDDDDDDAGLSTVLIVS